MTDIKGPPVHGVGLTICETCPSPQCDHCPVKMDPARFRAEEKKDRRAVRFWVIATFAAAIVIGVFANSYIRQGQILDRVNNEVKTIRAVQVANTRNAHETKQAVLAVGGYAATLDQKVDNVCRSLPGCVINPPSVSGG